MAIPDFQTIMLPLLRLSEDGEEHSVREATEKLAYEFGLTDAEREQLVPSGQQRTFSNRVSWAVSYLKQASLLESPGRGLFRIGEAGRNLLASPPPRITIRYLSEHFPAFQEFRARAIKGKAKSDAAHSGHAIEDDERTPEERLEEADRTLRTALEREILDRVKQVTPAFFERVVLNLLTAMGYGGSAPEAAENHRR
jgi:restriction system protein